MRGTKRVDLDGVVTLDSNGVELVVVHKDVGVFRVLVAAAFVLVADRLARDLVDKLLAEAVAGLLVDLPKRDTLSRR